MEFRDIVIRPSAGKGVAVIPPPLIDYCASLQRVPPNAELFIGDPDYDLKTLHASAGFRDAFARYAGGHTALVVDWKSGKQHEISENGQTWTDAPGLALKYDVAFTSGRTTTTVYMGILFKAVP